MPRVAAYVISHFYNEEYLLPWWLMHHRELFDHGVLIDYASTDNSVAICQELVPSWTILPSRNAEFNAVSCDEEVMDIERQLAGWKIALNTSEFLCAIDFGALLSDLSASGVSGAFLRGYVMVDSDTMRDVAVDQKRSLVEQRAYGYPEDRYGTRRALTRSRLLHRMDTGRYSTGRHASPMRNVVWHPPGAALLWYGFSPWTKEGRERKLQVKSRIGELDKLLGLGAQHLVEEADLEFGWQREVVRAVDLRTDPAVSSLIRTPDPRVLVGAGFPSSVLQLRTTAVDRRSKSDSLLLRAIESAQRSERWRSRLLAFYSMWYYRGVRRGALGLMVSPRLSVRVLNRVKPQRMV